MLTHIVKLGSTKSTGRDLGPICPNVKYIDTRNWHPAPISGLLRLELNSTAEGLRGEMCEYPIGHALPYMCISYAWGANRDKTGNIDIQGESLGLTTPISTALRWIRAWKLDQKKSAPVLVWIDYVCISQKDNAERAVQVSHMKTLYSQADLVLVFLGGEDQGSEQMPKLYHKILQTYARYYNASKDEGEGVISVEMKDLSLRELDGTGLAPRADPIWDANRAFLRRPWFLRTWIVQEAVLARELFFVCGNWGVEGYLLTEVWDIMLAEQLVHLVANQSGKEFMQRRALETRAVHQILHMLIMGMGRVEKKSASLIDLLQTSRCALATDPRDYVYGLLGLASDEYRAKVYVDYEESVADTYRRVARVVVELGEGVKLLYNIHGLDSELGLPSWIPDWSNQKFPLFALSPMPGSASTTTDIPYICAGGSQSEMRISDDGNMLHCEGYIVDVIDRVTDSNIEDFEEGPATEGTPKLDEEEDGEYRRKPSHSYQYLSQCLSEMAAILEAKSIYWPEMHEETIWRTAIWNRPRHGQRKADILYGALYKSFLNFTQSRSLSQQGLIAKHGPRMSALDKELGFMVPGDVAANIIMQEDRDEQDQAEKFANWAHTICLQTRRCGTARGYLGHVPKGARVGDVVCVITGAAVPFVIRQATGGYRVVGQCYLHEIMEGEVLLDPSMQKESIVLV